MKLFSLYRSNILAFGFYCVLIILVTWPLVQHLQTDIIGYLNIDSIDTIALRGLFLEDISRQPLGIFWPSDFGVTSLTPNVLDHLSALPFIYAFGFPLGDNLWWLTIILLNGLSGHYMGRQLGTNEASAYFCGTAFMFGEPLLREVNLHHAPQSMLFWMPLFTVFLLRLHDHPQRKHAIYAGCFLAGAALSYWYFGLFLLLVSIPYLTRIPMQRTLELITTCAILCLPALFALFVGWDNSSIAQLQLEQSFIEKHGNDLLFWLKSTPMDISNRCSILLIIAAIWASKSHKHARYLWFMAIVSIIMLMGPSWQFGQTKISLPFDWFASIHPVFARLHWPERWGAVTLLALTAIACKTPKANYFTGAIIIETLLFSANAPLQNTSMKAEQCLRKLQNAQGVLLEFPLHTRELNLPALHHRIHQRPMVNPLVLPAQTPPPQTYQQWRASNPIIDQLEQGITVASAKQQLRDLGIGAIYIVQSPSSHLTAGEVTSLRYQLSKSLGLPTDIGCALVWWLENSPPPEAIPAPTLWRAKHHKKRKELITVMKHYWLKE